MLQESLQENSASFLSLQENYLAQSAQGSSLSAFRKEAWAKFLSMGFPQKKQEAYRYLPLSQFYLEKFQIADQEPVSAETLSFIEECKAHGPTLVLINGRYSRSLSSLPATLSVQFLKEINSSHASFLKNRFSHLLKEEQDPFVCLSLAHDEQALFIYVPPKLHLEHPIQCVHVLNADMPIFAMPRIHLFLGKEARAQWIDQFYTHQENAYCTIGLLDVALEENAYLHYCNLSQGNDKGWHFDALRASLKSASEFQSIHYMDGAKSARQDIHVRLNAAHAKAELKGINLLRKNRGAHQKITMSHQSAHCHSMQLFKGVLNDASQSSFEGKIYVAKDAQKTEAYQLNHHLILKDHAIANSKPNLEIYADDVKASHGATVSQLCEEQILYLKTRGVSLEQSRQLLVSAFCREVLDLIPHKFLEKRLQEALNQVIS